MPAKNVYRVYTEDKNKGKIIRLIAKQWESFTVQPTIGYYRGKPEKSIVIEIVGARSSEITKLAVAIQKMNGQKSVLILKGNAEAKTTRG
jgi:hypothetical protein